MDESVRPPAVDSNVSENHMTEGSIGQSEPSTESTNRAVVMQQPSVPAPAKPAAKATAPVAAAPAPVAPAPAAVVPAPTAVATQPPPPAKPTQPSQPTAVASVNVQDAGAPRVVPAPRTQRGRDSSLERRPQTTQQGSTPETDELVKESAKLDPSLPPPTTSPSANLSASTHTDQRSNANRGSSQTGAAHTDQLVRDSARLDPSLPPPDMSAVRATTEQQDQQRAMKPGAGSNPVAAAMTDQLVHDSAKLDPSLPPPK